MGGNMNKVNIGQKVVCFFIALVLVWSFTAEEAQGANTLSAPTTVSPGKVFTVTYTAPGYQGDWIAMYAATAKNEAYGEWHYLEGKTSGTLTFTAPLQPGEYELRMFQDWPAGGYTDIAKSKITVAGNTGTGNTGTNTGTSTTSSTVTIGNGVGTGATNADGTAPGWGCTVPGIIINAIDTDPENQLSWCDDPNNRVPFGSESGDRGRCMTFRYKVPQEGISSAFLRIAIKPFGDVDTDNIIAAVGEPTQECGDQKGKMSGCVTIHAGLAGYKDIVDMDLLCDGCVKDIKVSDQAKQALATQLRSGVLHVRLQDDTVVYGAQLVINCEPSCTTGGGTSTTGTSTTGTSTGSPEPAQVDRMTIQATRRVVEPGEIVIVPVWLIKGQNVANIDFTISYDPKVVVPEGKLFSGSLLENALFESNTNEVGLIRAAFSRKTGISGTGIIANINFKAVGKPGDQTVVSPLVTVINDPNGNTLTIERIDGLVRITGPGGILPGDCDGDSDLTSSDAWCALEMSVRLRPTRLTLDLDQNNAVNSRDATMIQLKLVPKV